MANKLKIGFIGLGLMGGPMAKNVFKAGNLGLHLKGVSTKFFI